MTALQRSHREGVSHHTERLREMRAEDIVESLLLLNSLPEVILAFEGEEEEETEEESEEEESEEEEEEEEDDGASGLKSALRKEREARKSAQKQFKDLQRQLDEIKAKDAKDDEAKTQAQQRQAKENEAKLERVAAGFVKNAMETALVRALQDPKMPKFLDPDDVVRLVDRSNIDVDQDDDDPSDVNIDEDDLRKAIKALAKKKPHLLVPSDSGNEEEGSGEGKGSNTRSGTGKFNGKGGSTKETPEQRRVRLAKKYPALNRR